MVSKIKYTDTERKTVKKKTSIGQGKNTKYKTLNSSSTPPKGYIKKYRGQGKG